MNPNRLSVALAAALAVAPQAAPRTPQDRPHIEPRIELRATADAADTYELLIYGDIGDSWYGESVTAQSVAEQLGTLDGSVATINVRINSYGGSVADGLAIYNALRRHKATKAVTIDGVAMSSASLIAMAGDTVSMPPTSILMIHAPWGGCWGNAREMRQYADVLDKFSESMADAYVQKSGKGADDILSLLQDGEDHYYTGEEAVAEGFADAVTSDDAGNDDPDEEARAYANALLERISARGAPAKYAGMVVTAALRGSPRKPATSAAPNNPAAAEPAPGGENPSGEAPSAAPDPNPPAPAAAHTPPADAGQPTHEENTMTREEILAADKTRREAIRNQFKPFASRTDLDQDALAKLQSECEDNAEVTAEAAGQKLLAFLGTAQDATPTATGMRAEPGTQDETETYRAGAITSVLHRARPADHAHDERSAQFRGFDLMDLARDCVARAGRNTRGMSRREIAVLALQSTSDFPHILENVITKTLRGGYEAAARTFLPFSRRAVLPDFKQVSRAQLGGAPDLKRVVEGAEYEYGSIGDSAEKYQVQKYGRMVHLTWEAIVNDDLDALTRIPQAFGASAAELESDIVYGILTNNPAMADGDALFHANHGNLGTAADLADALDPAAANPLAEMRKMMTLQKGIEGRYITVRPRYLVVPPSLEEVALKVTSANFVASKGQDLNVFGPSLSPISEPRLEDASSTAWFAAAEPTTIDTIEYAYLEGHEGVFTETQNGFEVDGLKVKCRHVFGAKAIDWRGLFKNAGA